MPLPPFLLNHAFVPNAEQVVGRPPLFRHFGPIRRLLDLLEQNGGNLERSDVLHQFKRWEDDPILAALCAFVWGRILPENADRLLSVPSEELEGKLHSIRRLVLDGNIEEAYDQCNSGDLKLPGVGRSYFTKLFFFIAHSHEGYEPRPRPLIFDDWLITAYYTLLFQLQRLDMPVDISPQDINDIHEDLRRFGNLNGEAWQKGKGKMPLNNVTGAFYVRYCQRLGDWAADLHIEAADLEVQLFARTMRVAIARQIEDLKNWPPCTLR